MVLHMLTNVQFLLIKTTPMFLELKCLVLSGTIPIMVFKDSTVFLVVLLFTTKDWFKIAPILQPYNIEVHFETYVKMSSILVLISN